MKRPGTGAITRAIALTWIYSALLAAGCSSTQTSEPGEPAEQAPGRSDRTNPPAPLAGRIVYTTRNGPKVGDIPSAIIHMTDTDGSDHKILDLPGDPEEFTRVVWSHDGSRLLSGVITDASVPSFRPAVSDPDGSNFRILDLPGLPNSMFCAAWAPDDDALLCSVDAPRPGIVRLPLRGRQVVRLVDGENLVIGYSPDGSTIAFVRKRIREGNEEFALYVAGADGSAPRRLTDFGAVQGHEFFGGEWLRSGSEILTSTPQGQLVRIAVVTGVQTPIDLDVSLYAAQPSISPDGSTIVFIGATPSRPWDIYTVSVDGGQVTPIRVETRADSSVEELSPDWQPDEGEVP